MSLIRVQLSRAKGWRMPPNTVKVSRPSRWGNPFYMEDWGREQAVTLYRDMLEGGWSPNWIADMTAADGSFVYMAMLQWRRRLGTQFARDLAHAELRGKNLACWCGLGEPCHADILLAIANADEARG